ncbi:5,10-methenyltetrahydrofolate synthetase (5-formyltetrahydrofolate cyclo-ligase) isoform X1 [Pygocentrus nattereri]|uniref:5-formyltetrahydrofolate cyclo-ligase n=2 Tax=Pygocentrus nattereri TaxID=42514 RepID=A0A3B4DW17_PYGNA|nr:5,10-methenyltetrahydrofolate synthetase (5-formyltetrahydrofolate cyclo-ligase) isoform X1 [Pygocentrus nattereri]
MTALRAAKQALRKEIKKRVASLSEEEKVRQSQVVSQKLLEHPKYQSSQRIAVFLSMPDEVRTEAIVQHMFSSGKVCFIPKYLTNSSHMDMLQLNSLEDIRSLPLTSWNIRQPADSDAQREEALDTGGLDLILMPGLGFDKSGNRLGRGKGFYDTYLERCMRHPKGKPYTIALAFKEQLCKEVPVDDSDMLVNEVLYEE